MQRILDVGCGNDKLPGAIGIDVNPNSAADIIRSLDDLPWPLEDSWFDRVRAQDVLEHVQNFLGVIQEIHRVAKPGALVEVRMPFMSSSNYATDPTHLRSATSRTFDYFDPAKDLSKYGYSPARFRVVELHYGRGYTNDLAGRLMKGLDRAIIPVLERHPETYESYFAYLYPMHDVSYVLRVEK